MPFAIFLPNFSTRLLFPVIPLELALFTCYNIYNDVKGVGSNFQKGKT